ncbi:universal stress protein [Streptomyces sp. NPDC057428]|uniref:universal stress protein n=1 Tax=Streptomyces sp. NPDC057428 TaxID=3346129 RepID=UPI00368427C4
MDRTRPADGERIIVGVDGSEASKRALRWALEEAEARHATVKAVTAWQLPDDARGMVPHRESFADSESAARQALDDTVRDVTSAMGLDAPEINVREGHPAEVLVSEAREADLVVVGNRGHGRFAETLLGSVGQRVIEHAACPVVVTH